MGGAPGAFISRGAGQRPESESGSCGKSQRAGSSFFTARLQLKVVKMRKTVDGTQVMKEGVLEKRGDSLLQLWKKKYCVLTQDCLRLYPDSQKRSRSKDLSLQEIRTVDCVERTGKYIYFTVVTTDNKEMDFRCLAEGSWNAAITMALIEFKNKKAIQSFRSRQDAEMLSVGQQEKLLGRAP
ncbi:pleckstrin homology-like domain family A member 2 [Mobula hypostoma]|uniref:pleckstrin homology-like domain family A member 2 n=1 Tax=Mobula hypostoma TaxID=723540 RepID=UPI002FC3D892